MGFYKRREAASVRDEHIPTSGGSLSSLGHHHPPSQDMEDQKLCGNLWQVSNPFPDRLRDALPGSRDELRQCLQHHQKIFFTCSAAATVYLMFVKFKATYDGNHDSFRVEFVLIPVAILALVLNNDFTPMEVLWTFSIYLESLAILPQLFMVSKTGEAETITSHYLFALGSYRALYILNWIYRFYFESFYDIIAIVAGVVQTVLYCDFFYLYVTKVMAGKKIVLPA